MSIQHVAVIGGTGTIGAPILAALKSCPSFSTISVLNRSTSTSTYPSTHVITIPSDLATPSLTALFKHHAIDALVIAIAGSHVDEQKRLIDAAFQAGVQRVIPAEFGSCDSADPRTCEVLPLMAGKKVVREYLEEVARRERPQGQGHGHGHGGRLTWTALVTGHFFDYGLTCGLLKFDVERRTAYLVDGGAVKFSASTLPFIADAVVRVLERPVETENRLLYVQSHYVTQLEVLAALEKVTGGPWERVQESSEEVLAVARPKMLEGEGEALEEVVAVWGIVASDWKGKHGFANEVLGLEEERLEETVRAVLGDRGK
ncbi:isoflavone reductase family protein [Massariosphaeria phaeospora]|uniref:Isoflavone reductase family protein n=1 Tax=Massariosphaeria phaeospora TaxID=100035 RepID=A0A7C8I742_9PLEO|nr:isoflavone reductase family protein [Massariosphaeria phaeospora]